MDEKNFEKIDEKLMRHFQSEREKGVHEELLRGFSASVENKIVEKQKKRFQAYSAPVLIPAFAVLLLASFVTLKQTPIQGPAQKPYMEMFLTSTADVAEEISALQELGLWGEEDQETLGVSDLEFSSD